MLGPTDGHGNAIYNIPGAVGYNAHADSGGIAIGAGSSSGNAQSTPCPLPDWVGKPIPDYVPGQKNGPPDDIVEMLKHIPSSCKGVQIMSNVEICNVGPGGSGITENDFPEGTCVIKNNVLCQEIKGKCIDIKPVNPKP